MGMWRPKQQLDSWTFSWDILGRSGMSWIICRIIVKKHTKHNRNSIHHTSCRVLLFYLFQGLLFEGVQPMVKRSFWINQWKPYQPYPMSHWNGLVVASVADLKPPQLEVSSVGAPVMGSTNHPVSGLIETHGDLGWWGDLRQLPVSWGPESCCDAGTTQKPMLAHGFFGELGNKTSKMLLANCF